MKLKRIPPTLFCLILFCASVCFADQYKDILKKQGYVVMKTPRSDFGTGTITGKRGNDKMALIASPSECFPNIDNLIPQQLVLMNSHQDSGLKVDAGASFIPGGGGVLGSIKGALGFHNLKKLDLTFGKTTSYEWTVEGFTRYLENKRISKRCFNYLTNKDNVVYLSAVKVDKMSYTFHGDKKTNPKVDVELLKSTLKANGAVDITNVTDNSFTVDSPMFIAYKAYRFLDLGIDVPEAGDAEVTLVPGKFVLRPRK